MNIDIGTHSNTLHKTPIRKTPFQKFIEMVIQQEMVDLRNNHIELVLKSN